MNTHSIVKHFTPDKFKNNSLTDIELFKKIANYTELDCNFDSDFFHEIYKDQKNYGNFYKSIHHLNIDDIEFLHNKSGKFRKLIKNGKLLLCLCQVIKFEKKAADWQDCDFVKRFAKLGGKTDKAACCLCEYPYPFHDTKAFRKFKIHDIKSHIYDYQLRVFAFNNRELINNNNMREVQIKLFKDYNLSAKYKLDKDVWDLCELYANTVPAVRRVPGIIRGLAWIGKK